MADEPETPDRRGQTEKIGEFSEMGSNRYRYDEESGRYRFREQFVKHPAEVNIAHIRQHLALIEGRVELGNLKGAKKYLEQMEPWIYQLKLSLDA